MHHAAVVAELQARQQVAHDPDGVGDGETFLLIQQILQRRAVDVFHNDVGEFAGFAVVEDADDVGMRQATGGLSLPLESRERFLGFGVGGIRQVDGFDRHAPFDNRIPAFVDCSHRTAPELALDLVLSEGLDRRHAAPCVSLLGAS